MYIVRSKKTKKIIHINPAPPDQHLTGEDVYYKFNAKTMEIGVIDGEPPEHFDINEAGQIVELTLEQQVKEGIIKLEPRQKIENNKIVEKTLSEKIADGLIILPPTQKIVREGDLERIVVKTLSEQVKDGIIQLADTQKITGEGENQRIVNKTLSEQVEEGLIKLLPHQQVTGEGDDERIVEKPIAQQVAEGLIKLEADQKLEGDNIVEKSKQELLDEGLISLEEIKEENILRLRNETESFLSQHKTPNGFRLDQLTRQKANFSYQFRHLPDTDESKKKLLDGRMIYPDQILDEIVAEVAKVQLAFDAAKKDLLNAYEKKEPVSAFESIVLSKYVSQP